MIIYVECCKRLNKMKIEKYLLDLEVFGNFDEISFSGMEE